ncbi:helix-turn-helix domain-containing protein [Niabella insulamsoli]|uniref:helix-turn-helix domain-containing protein n=1 Tax=Niabella insulamsoli TaxID=3144874 RepID=UPI0031FD47DB
MINKITFDEVPSAMVAVLNKLHSIELAITQLTTCNTKEPDCDLMTVDEAADFLHLSKQTVYQDNAAGKLPSMKKGKRVYFLKSDLIKYLKDGKRKTKAEAANDANKFLANQ